MKKFLKIFAAASVALLLVACIVAVSLYQWAASDLPSFTRLADYRPPLATTVLPRDGPVMGLLYNDNRFPVSPNAVSPHFPKSILAF